MERKNAVAVITARGGSKRIPHKNIKEYLRETHYRVFDRGGIKERRV